MADPQLDLICAHLDSLYADAAYTAGRIVLWEQLRDRRAAELGVDGCL